ncbi:MAG: hypothetical protein IJV29_18800 [Butyrivibrio sp.]|nr:hypothetical protein [Butyrivibrio sp.]MBQ7431662.1 hypothetical protein [Butyrivibrio sp.]
MGEELVTQGLDIQVIVTGVVGLITTITSGWASWLFAKKKYNAEVDTNLIENMQKSLDFYMKLSDDNKARLDEALKRNDTLEEEIRDLRKQMFELMNNICYDMTCELRSRQPKRDLKVKPKTVQKECKHDTKEGK